MSHVILFVLWCLGALAGWAVTTRRWFVLCGALGWSLLAVLAARVFA